MANEMDEDLELLKEFLTEANDKIGEMDLAFLALEKDPGNRELIESIFRQLHTIKGNSGFFGFHALEAVAHAGEYILADVRAGKLDASPEIVSLLLECADAVRSIVTHLTAQGTEGPERYEELRLRLEQARNSAPAEAARPAGVSEAVAPPPEPPAPTPSPAPVSETTLARGGPEDPPTRQVPHDLADTTIRVSVKLIEDLMNQVGELVLCRNQILQHVSTRDVEALETATQALDHLTSRLQENMMKTRLQPVGNVFNKFPRIVRELARTNAKMVEVQLEGQSTEVDKTLIEAINDPLTHIIRNAVDHGIEGPADRLAAGKARNGTVRLKAHHEGGQVVVTISDDGRGMSPEKLVAKAVEKGLLTEAEGAKLNRRQAMKLIFAPGFSTAEKITNISGRGVGMDVVKKHVERVNGRIDIESEVGVGTTFRLQIPLTLAIIPALIVRVGGERFAIPQVNLVELVFLEGPEIDRQLRPVKNARVIHLREELVPVVALRSLLGFDPAPPPKGNDEPKLYIVVVRFGAQLFGLIVDEGLDTEEIVVKPLVSHVKRIGCYAGTTIMGDGQVALILDIPGVMRMCGIADEREVAEPPSEVRRDSQSLLVFTTGDGQLLAIPLILISRIEELESSALTRLGGRPALHCSNGLVPLIQLNDHLDVGALGPSETVTALIFEFGGKSAAIAVGGVVDSVEFDGFIDTTAFARDGVLGSLVLEGRGVLVLDVYRILERSDPDWFRRARTTARTPEDTHILVVEDSAFFTNLVVSYLEGAGFDVSTAPDGREGLRRLQEREYDLVVSDLEMPEMDGFTMVETIRRDPRYRGLPIIALTSLDSAADRARATRCGFDEYRIKLNREELLDAASRLLDAGRPQRAGEVNP